MQKLKPEIRTKILTNALTLFYKKGYEDTTMRRIAAKSHITVGNIYRYFKNKEILFDEVIIDAYDAIYDIVMTSANLTGDELLSSEHLNRVLDGFAKLCEEYPKHIVVFLTRYLTTGTYPLFTKFEKIVDITLKASNPNYDDTTTKLLTHLLLQGVLFTLKSSDRTNIKGELTILFNILFRDSRSLS